MEMEARTMKNNILHARLTEEIKDKLDQLAKLENRSITNMIETLIIEAYEKKNTKKECPDQ